MDHDGFKNLQRVGNTIFLETSLWVFFLMFVFGVFFSFFLVVFSDFANSQNHITNLKVGF